ncbi:MAG: hypothetical protein AMXMBFR82_17280 [Candidatus Hydrogenedentota bacterium]
MKNSSAGFRIVTFAAAVMLLAVFVPTATAQNVNVAVTKDSTEPQYIPGSLITYTIVVSNAGPDAANGVAIMDQFPNEVFVFNIDVTLAGGAVRTQINGDLTQIDDVADMPAGSSITYTVEGQVGNEGVTFNVDDLLPDTAALLPLNDWAPLFIFTMEAGEAPEEGTPIENTVDVTPPQGSTDASANDDSSTETDLIPATGEERELESLVFRIKPDPIPASDRSYNTSGLIQPSDILEYAVFVDGNVDPDDRGTFDSEDFLVVGRSGTAYAGLPLIFDVDGIHTGTGLPLDNDGPGNLQYDMDFSDFEINVSSSEDPINYILVVRTTATWRNLLTLAYDVTDALMVLPNGLPPAGSDGNPDTYNPLDEDPLDPETAYSSAFSVWDRTSGPGTNAANDPEFANAWAHPRRMYTPLAEYRRPRFDAIGTAFDLVTGEFLELRQLMPLDNWTVLMGIDLHGVADRFGPAILKEVNVILTDIGANPVAPAGNGGFNPTNGLETLTSAVDSLGGGNFDPDTSIRRDFGFNGLWVFADTNGNAVFDAPTPLAGGGVQYNGDYPMWPEFYYFNDSGSPDDQNNGLPRWEYLANPPGGGDPWWKLRMRFDIDGRRRDLAATPADENDAGWLAPTPDGNRSSFFTGFYSDYFVVVRPDSGYADQQALGGDGVGMTIGADFRAFIEPRRFNPNSAFGGAPGGQWDGGIFVSSQIPSDSSIREGNYQTTAWQEDPRWGVSEPWWPQRTLNETNAKPVRTGAEIHDLVITYETNNLYSQITNVNYASGLLPEGGGVGGSITNFDLWLDPFGLRASTFQNFHSVGVGAWRNFINGNPSADDHIFNVVHYPYETVPFFLAEHDLPPFGPRSAFLPIPATATTLPDYFTWPASLQPGEYPRESQWPLAQRASRYLKQHIEPQSTATAMLGINLVGADDPTVNAIQQIKLQQITVAFWGPNFDPAVDLLALDPLGTSSTSGVMLVEDISGDGVFGAQITPVDALNIDAPVQLTNLAWRTAPELVDLTGDGVADDLSGDGVVTDFDKAWVLRMRPVSPWPLPVRDAPGGNFPGTTDTGGGGTGGGGGGGDDDDDDEEFLKSNLAADPGKGYWAKEPVTLTESEALSALASEMAVSTKATKAIGPEGNPGDDLFLVVRTSDKISRFEQFRAVVPSTLPERTLPTDRVAGIQLEPQTPISQSIYQKSQPEENAVQPYYGPALPTYAPATPWLSYDFGYDMIEANIATKLVDLTGTGQIISKNSGDVAVLGIDLSTNRGTSVGTVASGSTGVGSPAEFTVAGAGWTPGAFTGYFLVDKNYQSFRITGNNANRLFLQASANAAGTPASGAWRVVRDPSFLEQVIIEFYDVGRDGAFNILDDLLPLDINPNLSGVKLYRDNDNDPANENGVFDSADIPVPLDYAPFQIGQAGEPSTQVMMVFSSPGTDNIPVAIANQKRHRQWIYDTFGTASSDPAAGSDFFVVISTSDGLQVGDDFRVGLVSWGPNTPTEPDPDTFPPPPASRVGEFDVFSEFPWGARALGFITFFTDQPYYKQFPEEDNSGFDWVRSTANRNTQTRTITGAEDVVQGDDVAITNVLPSQLPKVVGGGGLTLSITGQNFGTSPIVTLDGVALTVVSATNTQILATIPGGITLDSDNNNVVTLKVTNSTSGQFDTYNGFTVVPGSGGNAPTITSINPSSGGQTAFPVTITGTNFDDPKVFFGGTVMPINSWTPTSIVVGFPVGGLPVTGPLDVTVQNQGTGLFAVAPDGFNYINNPGGGGGGGGFQGGGGLPTCFIATAAYGSPLAGKLDTFREFRDAVLLKTAVGAALVDLYYTVSPPLADYIAAHPAIAAAVRLALTPVAWSLASPVLALTTFLLLLAGAWTARRRWSAVRA